MKKSECNLFAVLDNHPKNVKARHLLVTEQRIDEKDFIIRSNQFEDLFDSELLIKCMREIASDFSFSFELSSEQLQKSRDKGTDVINILRSSINNIDDYKTELSARLINDIVNKITQDNSSERVLTPVENEIITIMDRILKKSEN